MEKVDKKSFLGQIVLTNFASVKMICKKIDYDEYLEEGKEYTGCFSSKLFESERVATMINRQLRIFPEHWFDIIEVDPLFTGNVISPENRIIFDNENAEVIFTAVEKMRELKKQGLFVQQTLNEFPPLRNGFKEFEDKINETKQS